MATATEVKEKAEKVVETLSKLRDGISDVYNSTHSILETLSQFAYTGLDDLIGDVEEIRDDLEDLEEDENQ